MSIIFEVCHISPAVLWGFGKGEAFGIQPFKFYNFVREYGFSTSIVDTLLESLKPYLLPQKNKSIFHMKMKKDTIF